MSLVLPRRTLLRGTAWTAPAVVIASAAPAFANSPVVGVEATMGTVVRSGNTFTLPVHIDTSEAVTISIVVGTFLKTIQGFSTPAGFTATLVQPSGNGQNVVPGYITFTGTVASNASLDLTFTINSPTQNRTVSVDLTQPSEYQQRLGTFTM